MRRTTVPTIAAAALAAATPAAATGPGAGATGSPGAAAGHEVCAPGQFCSWGSPGYDGPREVWELAGLTASGYGYGDCIPLPSARSLANRTGYEITVYQSPHCDPEGQFVTVPGWGAHVPDTPFVVRGYQVQQPN